MKILTILVIMMTCSRNAVFMKTIDSYDVDVELSGEVSDEKSLKLLGALLRKLKAKFHGINNQQQIGLGYPGAGCGYSCYQPFPQYPFYGYYPPTIYQQQPPQQPPIYQQQQQQPIIPQIFPQIIPQPIMPQQSLPLPQPQPQLYPTPNLYQNYPAYPMVPYPQNNGCCLRCSYPIVGC